MEEKSCSCQVLDAWMTDTGRVHIELECDVTKQQEIVTEIKTREVATEIPAEAETPIAETTEEISATQIESENPEQGPAEEALEE
jgi:hypothetical protein